MARKYDVVVVGAGLGGLSAATLLAKKGLNVLLLEKHNVPGGYATSFVRGRYEFEVALHELSGVGTPEHPSSLHRYLNYLGVAERVEFIHMPYFYRSIFPDLDIRLPVGREKYEDVMCESFPRDAKGIKRFIGRFFELEHELVRLMKLTESKKLPSLVEIATLPINLRTLLRYAFTTWAQVLNRDVKDPKARAVLSQIWGYFGLPPSKISYLYFANAMASYIKNGPTYIKGRSQALSNAFVTAFEEHGGEVRFNCGAQKITTSNGRITGVITEDGEEILANCVVSNASPVTTCRDLIGVKNVPQSFFNRLRSSTVGASSVIVYMGVARSPAKLRIDDHEVFINANYDFESHYEKMKVVGLPEGMVAGCYNHVFPEVSPSGTSMVVLTTLAYGEPWTKIPPEQYVRTKNRVADAMISMAEKVLPGLRKYAEVVEVATPITNMRYTRTLGGAIYGFDQPPSDATVWRISHKGPLEGLYFVGAWTPPGGGFEPSMLSGRMAGEMISRKVKKTKRGA